MTQATGRICTSICPLTIVAATCRLVLRTLLDLYVFGDPWFVAADVDGGDADWIMVGEVPRSNPLRAARTAQLRGRHKGLTYRDLSTLTEGSAYLPG